MPPPGMGTGHVRAPGKDMLIDLSARRHKRAIQTLMGITPPPVWDSLALGWVGPIKNQGSCGSCWDFSGVFVVECAYHKAGVFPADGTKALSEQYVLSCGNNGGCNGDDNTTVLAMAKSTGLPLTADYGAYTASRGRCKFTTKMTLYKVDDWGFADPNAKNSVGDTQLIKAAIMEYGCVGSAVDAGFRDPGTGVISGGGRNINHDVALIGWDDSKGKKGAWRMRNSWGTGWGDGGYAWIEYGSYSIGWEPVWAVVNSQAPPIDYYV